MPTFHPAVTAADIADRTSRAVQVEGLNVAIARVGDSFFAVENRCTHMGVSLADGPLAEGGEIVCPWHAAKFCVRSGERRAGPGLCSLKTFPVRVVDGVVEVAIESESLQPHPLMGKRAAACLNAGALQPATAPAR